MTENFHVCGMCNQQFVLKSTLLRHQAKERPGFIAWAAEKNAEYEVSRRRYRMIHPIGSALGKPTA
jgi:hypothetical protein